MSHVRQDLTVDELSRPLSIVLHSLVTSNYDISQKYISQIIKRLYIYVMYHLPNELLKSKRTIVQSPQIVSTFADSLALDLSWPWP